MSIRDKLIAAGVANLHTYGYPHCNKDNILTDKIYKAFFESMLHDNLGHGVDDEIYSLIKEIEE